MIKEITNLTAVDAKAEIEQKVQEYLQSIDFQVINKDFNRPWGGFFVIDESQTERFINYFFPDQASQINYKNRLSPKILVVGPGKRLSWQYHNRRSEIWKLISGTASVGMSDTDEEKEIVVLEKFKTIHLPQGDRHRLIGTGNWGIVAEIWNHTNPEQPSNEDDIVRVQDDFGR